MVGMLEPCCPNVGATVRRRLCVDLHLPHRSGVGSSCWCWLVMLAAAASWIALGPVRSLSRRLLYPKAWLARLPAGAGLCLALITQGVLGLEPWFKPRYVVPLGGMTFSVAMNAVSLWQWSGFVVENPLREPTTSPLDKAGMRAALDSDYQLATVRGAGIVAGDDDRDRFSLAPTHGSPREYQIMVMGMMFGSGGLSAAVLPILIERCTEFGSGISSKRERTGAMNLKACHCCGQIHRMPQLALREVAACTRCGAGIERLCRASRPVALPRRPRLPLCCSGQRSCCRFLQIEKMGQRNESSLLVGTIELLREGEWFVGIVVLLFSIRISAGENRLTLRT